MSATVTTASPAPVPQDRLELPNITLGRIVGLLTSTNGIAAVAFVALLLVSFWPWVSELPHDWFKQDSYVQHGFLVPFASLYIGWLAWKKNRDLLPLRPTFWPAALLIPCSLVNALVMRSGFTTLSAILLVICGGCGVWAAMGGKWLVKMTPALAFLSMTFSLWGEYLDQMTLSAQTISSKVAVHGLSLVGLLPKSSPDDPNLIYLPHYEMNIGAACSGLKMTLAVLTCAIFIVIVGRLRWWANAILLVAVVPMALLFNSLRIGLIGVFGEFMGPRAGTLMHDFGSYGILFLAFFSLYRLARALGWKV